MSREIIAILRGIDPHESMEIGEVLLEAGIDRIEVPLNSPHPLHSIERLASGLEGRAIIGAGTVLGAGQVDEVRDAGGMLIVSPDCNPAVIERSRALGLQSFPGVATPSECFTALRHGANGLKFFPAFMIGPAGLSAMLAVLPRGVRTFAVGGAGPANFKDWFDAGVSGFGIGTAIYKPGFSARQVAERAREIVSAYDAHRPGSDPAGTA